MKTLIKEHTRPADGGGIRYLLFKENEGGGRFYSAMIELSDNNDDSAELLCDIAPNRAEALALFERFFCENRLPARSR